MTLYSTSILVLSVYEVVLEIIDFTMRILQEEAHCSWDNLSSTASSHCQVNLKRRQREGEREEVLLIWFYNYYVHDNSTCMTSWSASVTMTTTSSGNSPDIAANCCM